MKKINDLTKKCSFKIAALIVLALFTAFSLSAQLTVTPNGNVGIGTTAPAAKLDVSGNMRLSNEIRFTNDTAMKGLIWGFNDLSGYNSRIDDYDGHLRILTDDHFYLGGINANGTPGNTSFYVNTVSGNIGIGLTAPTSRLHVAGDIRLNESKIYLRGLDNNHGIGYDAFNTSIDGPVIFGFKGGALGSTWGGNSTSLIWNNDGNIGIGRTPLSNVQLALEDKYEAGGKNLLIGNDAYLTDVDFPNLLGIYGEQDNAIGGIQLGSSGPRLWGQGGALSIGNTPSAPVGTYKLLVEGGILTEKLKVALKNSTDWADYVFGDNYQLMPLEQVAEYIGKNKHLPGLPSAEKLVAGGGIDMNEMFAKQMEKIEELTLYVIDLNRKMAALTTENQQLKQSLSSPNK